MRKTIGSLACATVATVALLLVAMPSLAEAKTGAVRLTLTRVGFIVGVGGGDGILAFGGRRYGLSVGGVSVGTFGAARADLVGRAYNLRRASDIAGVYTAVSAGLAVAGGRRAARLRNANGVVLELRGRQVGFELSLDLSGLSLGLR